MARMARRRLRSTLPARGISCRSRLTTSFLDLIPKNADSTHMRRILAIAAVIALTVQGAPLLVAAAGAAQQAQSGGTISGTATTTIGEVMANTAVQLRNLATGQVAAATRSD